MTDFGKIKDYAAFVQQDPFRNGLHYPAVVKELGDMKKRILDVGCGDGRFPRQMAEQGASVVGYDMAPEKIAEAEEEERSHPLNIKYAVATPQTFFSEERFDAATSVLVLPYAPSIEELRAFFSSTCSQLIEGGKFVSVVFNPSFSAFGEDLGSRRFTKLNENDVQVEFLDPKSHATQFTSVLHPYTSVAYEQAAKSGGFRSADWKALHATPSATQALGEKFWEKCHREQPYAVLITQK